MDSLSIIVNYGFFINGSSKNSHNRNDNEERRKDSSKQIDIDAVRELGS